MKARPLPILLLLLFVSVSAARSEIYLWPLYGARRLSSTFGEYRRGHYHAGIDIRTGGRVGLPCLAVGNGYVSRIKIAPYGYGKAVYLRLDDGLTAVYAHIDSFNRLLDSLTYDYRLARETSWCDITFPEGRYVIAVGETLCYTGETGTSAPHLHFELRDERERPFNPLERLYAVPDEYPPIISGLEVVPLERGSIVENSPHRTCHLFRASSGNRFHLEDTLHLDGRFGFGVTSWDEQGYGRYHMAPFSIELSIDGRRLYRLANTTFSYAQTGQITLEYDLLGEGVAGRYILLYPQAVQSVPGREGQGAIRNEGDGVGNMRLGPGKHRGEILVTDASGNESRASFIFVLHSYPEVQTMRKLAAAREVVLGAYDPDGGTVRGRLFESLDGGGSWRAIELNPFGKYMRGFGSLEEDPVYRYEAEDDEGAVALRYFATPRTLRAGQEVFCECRAEGGGEALVLRIFTNRFLSAPPVVERIGTGSADTAAVYQLGPQEYSVFFEHTTLTDGINVFRISGTDYRGYALASITALRCFVLETGKRVAWNMDSISVTLEAVQVRQPVVCLVREVPPTGIVTTALKVHSASFRIDVSERYLARPLKLHCDPGPGVGLFRLKNGTEWECVGVPEREGGYAKVDLSGVYAFFLDGLPPHMKQVEVTEERHGSGFFRRRRYYVPVIEQGSGIDPYSSRALLDGKRVVCEWDEFRERIEIPIPASIVPRPVSLRVEVSDRAGNSSVGEFTFVIQ
ncbi:MAG: M23 family metallopeptidase [bacterium]|nr:MAG: M23 family metallopeptidase [bacterium]